MRTVPGTSFTVATGVMSGAEEERSCYEGCESEPVTTMAVPMVDVRHGTMLSENLGVTAGLHLLAGPYVAKTRGWRSLAVAYGQVSWQSEVASAALGVDLGANVAAPVVGVDVQPWGEGRWRPNLAGYARYSQPFVRGGEAPVNGAHARRASWDAGGVLRIRPFMAQYSYYRQDESVADFPMIVEGSVQARAWHVVLVGVDAPWDLSMLWR
ncbi:hypothetical protein [Haliangium sp.]|uniref:hypothetical protein n=1 Tax=Haliangium sp. TaxID=2663208 RepID=UPI003D1401B8